MKETILSCILILFLFCSACEKAAVKGPLVFLYKTKGDYSKNVFITLSKDKTEVTAYPGGSDIDTNKLPIKITRDFILGGSNGNIGPRSVVTSLSIYTYSGGISLDSLFKLIIDFDPFIEYYVNLKNSKRDDFYNDSGIDTSKINQIILNDEIDKYFEKLK